MKPKDIIKLIPKLRKLTPLGIILLLFLLPLIFLLGEKKNNTPVVPPKQDISVPRVDLDPFRHQGAFAISQADADRASWSWSSAKKLATTVWEDQLPQSGRLSGFYCGCDITRRGSTGGTVDLNACGYEPRKSQSRASRLEWEHVVPAAYIGRGRSCWSEGAPQCIDKRGQSFKGRECCMVADPAFIMAASDPVNLVPSVGEVNGDRLDYLFGMIDGEAREYGQCDMEIDRSREIAEPPAHRRGDIARIWAYMSKAYGLVLPRDTAEMYRDWIMQDPISEEEIRINNAINRAGHRANPFVLSGPR